MLAAAVAGEALSGGTVAGAALVIVGLSVATGPRSMRARVDTSTDRTSADRERNGEGRVVDPLVVAPMRFGTLPDFVLG